MVCRIHRTGSTSHVADCEVPTLRARLMMALSEMGLLGGKSSLREDNGAYLMYTE
jgi:hypothetical protein